MRSRCHRTVGSSVRNARGSGNVVVMARRAESVVLFGVDVR